VVEQVAAELKGQVKIVGADVDESGDAASNTGITSIPALVFFKGGKEVHRIVGYVKKDKLVDEIRKHLLS
jgi:thioredoxin 1